ncbi:hypothetical protein EXIGLDRAFT_703088 [Exidia glandulosa HHB12029]|uniref:Uncharacterized protein n=1 Tax=Exidia glandulosa HHB12029 TaxID=1314781 RepID=A0A165C7N3_EXIGL|nr:hypothetical protein EXIGLDRAFT_703088 [Exidia glandulosa HHB12029]
MASSLRSSSATSSSSSLAVDERVELIDTGKLVGSFVIISPDPVASVALLEDDVATAAAAAIRRQKYLAFVELTFSNALQDDAGDWWPSPDEAPISFKLTGAGLGPSDPPWACVGLNEESEHVNGRLPIVLSPSLPWDNCYIHTLHVYYVYLTRIFLDHASDIRVTKEQHWTLDSALIEDMTREQKEKRALKKPAAVDGSGSRKEGSDDADTASTPSCDDPATASEPDAHPSETGGTGETDEHDKLARMLVKVEMWLDLAIAKDLGSPEELTNTVKQLEAIEQDWARRKVLRELADQPQTDKWAQDVAATRAAAPDVVREDVHSIAAESAIQLVDVQPGSNEGSPALAPEDSLLAHKERLSRTMRVLRSFRGLSYLKTGARFVVQRLSTIASRRSAKSYA